MARLSNELPAEYSHTQNAPLCLVLYLPAVLTFALAFSIPDVPDRYFVAAMGIVFCLFAPAFHYLRVEDRGEKLRIQFGPLPVFGRTVRYADIQQVEAGRTLILEGWGIHYSLRGGWVWNIWGRDCVVIRFQNGGTLRVGTDDAETLTRFLDAKITQ